VPMNSFLTFVYAWAQVSLIALNTYQVANAHWIGALIVSFLISILWTLNVSRTAFGTARTRIVYALGSMIGTGTGILIASLLY